MTRPDRHHCPGLRLCGTHPKWHVIVRDDGAFLAYPPRGNYFQRVPFPTHAEAVIYATTRARAELHDAIQNQPQEVCS